MRSILNCKWVVHPAPNESFGSVLPLLSSYLLDYVNLKWVHVMTNKNQPNFDELLDELIPDFMAEVKPIKSDPVAIQSFGSEKGLVHALRRKAATSQAQTDPGAGLTDEVREWVDPEGILEWCDAGIQKAVFRNFKLGKYGYDASIDLHKMRVAKARVEIAHFIQQCHRRDVRTALIIHGKGSRSKDRPALLKSLCYQWLLDLPLVLAFHTAQKSDGGAGATYVMIRKSEASKIENREQNRRR